MKNYWLKFIILAFIGICLVRPIYSQTQASDSSFHPFHVNYWVTGGIITVSAVGLYLESGNTITKPAITNAEIINLNRDVINSFDKWALKQDPSKSGFYSNLSENLLTVITLSPALMLFDKTIRQDWLDVLLMYLETMAISNDVYVFSFLGPNYQNKFRPKVYYDAIPMDQRTVGGNRNSFYSGHTASASAASFFIAKVFTDYHPELGAYKYLVYTAAAIPPLILGYCRIRSLHHFPSDILVGFGVGALCGIVVPEFHRLQDKNISLGLFASPEATGITLKWQPNILK
ncbi:MAG: phosphatase PAP2 family protein [FCB group bacterium]|jgi:membrane-associated phospholipid phosphatase